MTLTKKVSNTTKSLVLCGFLGMSGFATGGYIVSDPPKPRAIVRVEQIEKELKNSLSVPMTDREHKLIDEQFKIMNPKNPDNYFDASIEYEDSKDWADFKKYILYGLSKLSFIPFALGLYRMHKEKKSR